MHNSAFVSSYSYSNINGDENYRINNYENRNGKERIYAHNLESKNDKKKEQYYLGQKYKESSKEELGKREYKDNPKTEYDTIRKQNGKIINRIKIPAEKRSISRYGINNKEIGGSAKQLAIKNIGDVKKMPAQHELTKIANANPKYNMISRYDKYFNSIFDDPFFRT